MPKIFISYRREDSQWPVDRIHSALKPHVADPKADIFVDVDNIPVGVDFAAYLDAKVAQCDVLLAVIGPDWLNIKNPRTGQRRLDDPKDFVRIEIASALKRGIAVAPVLLDGVHLPEAEDLPEDLRPLIGRQGVDVSRVNFDADVQRLINGLGLRPGKPAARKAAPPEKKDVAKSGPAPLIAVAALILAAGAVGAYGFTQGWFDRTAEASRTAGAAPATPAVDPAEMAAWGMADSIRSAEAYESYLAVYPQGAHAKEANAAFARIADDADWTRAAGGDRAALNAYLNAYPAGAHREAAETQLAAFNNAERAAAAARSVSERKEIERLAAVQRETDRKSAAHAADVSAWSIASGANTSAAYRAYLSSYPNGAYAALAPEKIAALDEAERTNAAASEAKRREADRLNTEQREADRKAADTRADNNAWSVASDADTAPAYRAYLKSYPAGAHAKQAKAKLEPLEKPVRFSSDSTIGEIMRDPAAKAVLAKHLPDVVDDPSLEQGYDLTLRDVSDLVPDVFIADKVRLIDSDLRTIR